MKTLKIILLFLLPLNFVYSQNISPYIIGFESNESISVVNKKLQHSLELNGIKVIGNYQPANDKNRHLIIFTSAELESAVKKIGGLAGFATTLRIAITSENGKTIVSYTNPFYWGNAYFRKDFDKVSSNYSQLSKHLENAMNTYGTFNGKQFGSKKGLSVNELQKYHYMIGMPYFDDTEKLGEFGSYTAAVAKIDASISKGNPNVNMVYKASIPGQEITLYGFALSGGNGEAKFLPIIDVGTPKHTAFLPYEVLVVGNKVVMLHGRYRIALSFPDLTMGTFSKIMSTPGNIEDLLKQMVK